MQGFTFLHVFLCFWLEILVLQFSAYFSEIVHTGHKCGLNRPHYTAFHQNFDVLQILIINDGTPQTFLRHTFDITLNVELYGIVIQKVVNRNIIPPEQKQVENALTYFEIKTAISRKIGIELNTDLFCFTSRY